MSEKKVYFEIDFLKFMFVIGMIYRHVTLYLYPLRNVGEYSIAKLNIFSFFLPITGAFIFILGLGLSLSKPKINTIEIKYIKTFIKIFSFVLLISLLTYTKRVGWDSSVTFIEYFLFTKWNYTVEYIKPGFYILLPISLLYLYNYFFKNNVQYIGYLLLLSIFIFFIFNNYYIAHYLLFGLIGYSVGYYLNIDNIFIFLKRYYIPLWSLIIYVSIYYVNLDVNIYLEMIMLFLFILFLLFPFIKENFLVSFVSKNIFLFYILHIFILFLIKPYITLDSYYNVFFFGIYLFILTFFIIFIYYKVITLLKKTIKK